VRRVAGGGGQQGGKGKGEGKEGEARKGGGILGFE
jgi:hypothetical protein